jgi:hypothetical protein
MNCHNNVLKSTKTKAFKYIFCVNLEFSAMFLTRKTWVKKYAQRMLHTVSQPFLFLYSYIQSNNIH